MIHSARSTEKFISLVRWLRGRLQGCPIDYETIAIGLLERLWHFTITSHKRGDIGASSNEVIAEAVGWFGDPDELIAHLVKSKWLNEHEKDRLIVDDWRSISREYTKTDARRPDLRTAEWKITRIRILERDDWVCAYCGKQMAKDRNATVDHIEPFSLNETPDDSELASACRSCNSRKGNR